MHNRGGAIRCLRELNRGNALILDGGDALGGSNTAFRFEEPILAEMRAAGYQAMAMGNREFHYFRWVQRLREQERSFPLLAANLRDMRSPHGLWQSHCYVSWGPLRIALVGLTPVQYPVGSAWEKLTGFRFYPPEESLRKILPRIGACDAVIVLSHLGLKEDRRVFPLFPELRLVLGAHSHDVLETPEKVGKSWLVQGGSHSRFVGEIGLSCTGRSIDWDSLTWKLHAV